MDIDPIENNNLLSIEVPESYYEKGKLYGDLFTDYLSMNIICIGLYRQFSDISTDTLLNDEFSFLAE
jgi:hypothetical protein